MLFTPNAVYGVVVMPVLDITPLGSSRSGTASAVAAIVDYLTRNAKAQGLGVGGPVGYFADRAEAPGIWRGRGVNGEQLTGEATAEQLTRTLLGGHPTTGAVLVGSVGSAGRAARDRTPPPTTLPTSSRPGDLLDVTQTAERLGVDRSYVKRVLLATERHQQNPSSVKEPLQPLHGVRDSNGRWQVESSEIDRFVRARSEPKVVVAYDATFKWEKSISLAWVQSDPATRRIIDDALNLGVQTGIAYLESHGLEVRAGDRRIGADGMWAVQYRHTTNRNLEPQLHDHVVIANIAADPTNGTTKTIAAKALFTHATTAGYLAGQAVRHHLTTELGYEWGPVHNGTCDLAHIPENPMRVMSTRSTEVRELAATYGTDSQHARRIAALATRRAKQEPADYAALEAKWSETLSYWGFNPEAERALHGRATPRTFQRRDAHDLNVFLDGPTGVTESSAVFDRNTVVRAIVAWDGRHGGASRLTPTDVEDLTTRWLSSDAVIQLDTKDRRSRYTTVTMAALETDVVNLYRNGHEHGTRVDNTTYRTEGALWEHATGHTLGNDQAAFIRHLVMSPDQFGLGVGPAGTGKTASLAVACRAWEAAGHTLIGATVTGAAADVLADACGIETRTIASLVAHLNTGRNPFTQDTVLIVDEASTLGNRDHHQLARAIHDARAIMRTIGDPAQHHAVNAGGLWTQLLDTFPDHVAHLQHNRRQAAPAMADIRRASDLLRNGRGNDAIRLLAGTDRLHTARNPADLIVDIVNDWHHDHQQHRTNGGPVSRMMTEHHTTRRLLNHTAQQLLLEDGTITGPGMRVGDETIHVGDEIITRTQNRDIQTSQGRFLRNGVTGTVIDIRDTTDGPVVKVNFPGFGLRSLDPVWLQQTIRPGVVGAIAPAYAITTHVAQGQTMNTGRAVITDTTTPEAAYVALTRGRTDTRLYILNSPTRTNRQAAADTAEFPVLLNQPELLDATAERLQQRTERNTATSLNPDALEAHRLSLLPISEIRKHTLHPEPAIKIALNRAQLRALINPPDDYLNDYGLQPDTNHPDRPIWDRAVGQRARLDKLHGHGQWHRTVDGAAMRQHHAAARTGHLDRIPLDQLLRRLASVHTGSVEHNELTETFERRIKHAIARPADYVIAILGRRPTDDDYDALQWDTHASLIERVRHRNGLQPTDHPTSTEPTAILGPPPRYTSPTSLDWHLAETWIEHIPDPTIEPELENNLETDWCKPLIPELGWLVMRRCGSGLGVLGLGCVVRG